MFDVKKTLEDGASNDRLQKFSQFQSQSRLEQEQEKDMKHLYRRERKSARPKFLSGR